MEFIVITPQAVISESESLVCQQWNVRRANFCILSFSWNRAEMAGCTAFVVLGGGCCYQYLPSQYL